MICYAARSAQAPVRFAFFFAFCVFLASAIGYQYNGVGNWTPYARMGLRGEEVASAFANPNGLAVTCYSSAAVLLFYSLRSRKFMTLVSVCVALVLAVITVKTVSRQGFIFLLFCFAMYSFEAFANKKKKLGFWCFVLLAAYLAFHYVAAYSDLKGAYQYRFSRPSTRTEYFATAIQDMGDTLFTGKGGDRSLTSKGIEPHFTFLYLHLGYGGICAWIYALWMCFLVWKAASILLARGPTMDSRVEIATFFCLFLGAQFASPFAPLDYGNMIALAIMERNFLAGVKGRVRYAPDGTSRAAPRLGT